MFFLQALQRFAVFGMNIPNIREGGELGRFEDSIVKYKCIYIYIFRATIRPVDKPGRSIVESIRVYARKRAFRRRRKVGNVGRNDLEIFE